MKGENIIYTLYTLIIGLMIGMFILALADSARGHDTHLDHVKDTMVQNSYDGKQFKTADDKCWEVYKAPHGDITSYSRLHIREIDCNDK